VNEGSTLSAATLIDGLRQRRPRETRTAPPRRRREDNPFALGASRGSKDMPGEIDGCSSLAQFVVAFEQAIFRKCEAPLLAAQLRLRSVVLCTNGRASGSCSWNPASWRWRWRLRFV
jgi:hypothetical protein